MTVAGPARSLRALLFAAVSVALVAGLRADSDGQRPGVAVLLAAVVAVAVLVRPLTGRWLRLPVLLPLLLGTELAVHAALLAVATGRVAHPGPVGWVCCPPTATTTTSWYDGVTARAGLLLLALQLLVAVLAALWLAGLEGLAGELARLVAAGAATVAALALGALVAGLLGAATALTGEPPAAPAAARRRGEDARRPHLAERALGRPRRGPPVSRPSRLPRPLSAPVRHAPALVPA